MAKPSGPGRDQLHRRGDRTWRDATNPTGPGHAPGEPEPPTESAVGPGELADGSTDEEHPHADFVEGGPTAGPGGGGATQSPDGAKHFEGMRGGQSRKA